MPSPGSSASRSTTGRSSSDAGANRSPTAPPTSPRTGCAMPDLAVDSSVVTKWVVPEADSAQAHRLFSEVVRRGERLIVLDLALIEVANAIWKRQHRGLITPVDAQQLLQDLLAISLHVEPA